ncbi:MAG: hypothetical protein ACRDI2_17115 [Chloroflexota bacterium]
MRDEDRSGRADGPEGAMGAPRHGDRDRGSATGTSHPHGAPGEAGDSVLREYVINRHGTDYVLYAGLLAEAHRRGLRAITTRLVQLPSPHNGFVAICHAAVATAGGTFQGLGEASPTMAAHLQGVDPTLLRRAAK